MSTETYGSYELLKRLATGGMAQIFLARQKGPQDSEKLLVVKRILPHLAENNEFVRMFLDEARIAARLNHPNIVQIFDLGRLSDSYFIAMEYIHGEDVRRVWKRAEGQGKPIPIPLVCRIVMDACSGLGHAHKKIDATTGKALGIVHRDVSPQNILVTFDGAVKVVDFGIAKAADQATVTKSGVLKGKYSYMSPEQASGKRLDQRSDIFALGVVLYELLTGTRLFKRHNEIQTLNAVTECKVSPPSSVNTIVPKDLDTIVLKALSKNPNDRYQDAQALHDALGNWLLEKKLPSKALQLSAFMHEIYRERLEREAREGLVAVALADAKEEPAKKAAKGKRLLPRLAPPPPLMDPAAKEGTKALPNLFSRVSSGGPTLIGEPTGGFEQISQAQSVGGGTRPLDRKPPSRARALPRWKWIVAAVALLTAGAVGTGLLVRKPPLAKIRIVSAPEQASVSVDGGPELCQTPCELSSVKAGKHTVALSKAGFLPFRLDLDVPKRGALELPSITLEPVEEVAPPPKFVTFTLRSDPTGAQVFLDGAAKGKTPLALELPPGTALNVRVEAAGFRPAELAVALSESLFQSEQVTLERIVKPTPKARTGTQVASTDVRETPSRPATGFVRFAVTPWADVTCGSHHFGTTPFADKALAAGTYECVFRNPDLGAKTERIEVRANHTSKVTVKF